MNKTYRLIWSNIKEAWVTVAENVRSSGGPTPITVRGLLAAAVLAASAGAASALPTGPNVISGTAGINTVGGTMTINNSANAIINWQGFSIGQGETARFIQPSALSAVLNRVTGGDPSKILGALQSNGKVLLINPNGILFGPNARVDVNGLIASTLNIANEDFLAGKMKFNAGPLAGKVENQGAITTPGGGQVYLIAADVENSGVITAPNGDVLLAAGKEVLLVDKNSPEIAVVVAAPAGQSLNLGSIVADAGRVGMYGSIVRQKGRIAADSAVRDAGGRIFLKATRQAVLDKGSVTSANGPQGGRVTVQATEGTTLVSGAIEAKSSQGIGGNVQILGQQTGLIDTAVVDVSGSTGGGSVLVGGDYQGKNPAIQNAQAAYMGKDAIIKADATDNGAGGTVVLWADDTTRYYGNIFARGGINSGDGGFVEVSGKNYLDFRGSVSTHAPLGNTGILLLDPTDITITASGGSPSFGSFSLITDQTFDGGANNSSSMGWDYINGLLTSNNVIVQTTSTGSGTGNITFAEAGVSAGGTKSLSFLAENNITVSGGIQYTSSGNLTLSAGANIAVNADIMTTGGGGLSLLAGGIISQTAPISGALLTTSSVGGTLLNNASNAVTSFSATNTTSGNIELTNTATTLLLNGLNINQSGGGNVVINNTGAINTVGWIQTTGNGSISLTATGGTATIGNSLLAGADAGTGSVTVTATGATSDIELNNINVYSGATGGGSGAISLNAGRNITLNPAELKTTGNLNLTAGGTITETGVGAIHGALLTTTSVGGTNLPNANVVTSFNATNSGSGNVLLANTAAPLTITGISQSGGGEVTVVNNGSISTSGAITLSDGMGLFTADGATSDITVGGTISKTSGSDSALTLLAQRSIVVSQPITSTSNQLDVNLVSHYLSDAATGSVSIQSNIATNGGGLLVSGGTVPATTGFAIGYDMASNAQRYGVYLDTNAQITTSGGNINIRGQGVDTATGDADGISLWSGQLNAGGGSITLIGKAGDNQASSSSGVYIANTVSTTGAGTITIEGTGGINTGTINRGVRLEAGHVSTVNGLLAITGTGGNSTGADDTGISTNAASTIQSTGTGSIKLSGTPGNAGSKGIDIAGVITTPELEVISSGTALFSALNQVGIMAANLTGAGHSLTYENATAFTVGTVGATTGVTTNNGAITLRAYDTTGTLLVNNNINAGTANVQIGRATGGAGTGGIEIASGTLVSGASISMWAFPSNGSIYIDGTVTGTTAVALDTNGTGALTTGASGLIMSDAINLVTTNLYTGSVGSVGTPLNTSPLTPGTGTTTFTIGQSAAGAPSSVNVFHNGIANIGGVNLGTNAPFAFESTGNLDVNSSINTGTGILKLAVETGNVLTVGATSLLGNTVNLQADKIDISSATVVGTAGSAVTIVPFTNSRPISLGPDNNPAGSLELSTNELGKVTASILRIGNEDSGAITVDAAIAPANVTTLSLGSGSTVSQNGAGTISINNLAVNALGYVDLSTVPNMVTNLAAQIGDGTHQNNNFSFKNGQALNIGSNLDGISGVSISADANNFNAGSPNSVIALTSSGALTQSAGALLAGKAVYAKGSTVALTESNGTGVIAGEATGGSFQYTSSNGIAVTTVAGASGIQNTGTGGDINLTGNGIGQSAILSTSTVAGGGAFNLSLVSSGPVSLENSGNNVSSISANLSSGTGSLTFNNGENLTVGTITTNGNSVNISVPASKSITANASIATIGAGPNSVIWLSGGGITYASVLTDSEIIALASKDPTQGITLSGGVLGTSNTQVVEMYTDKLTLSGGTVLTGATAGNAISISPYTANTPIVVGAGATPGTLYITDTSIATLNSPDLAIGSIAGDPYIAVSGAISVEAAIARAGKRVGLFSGAGVTQTAAITADSLGVIAGGSVILNIPNQVNNLAIETSSGAIDFSNSSALTIAEMTGGLKNPSTVTGLKSVAGGNIQVTASAGNITLASPVVTDTVSSSVTLQAPGAAIVDSNSSGASILAKGLDVSAYSGIGTIAAPLKTQVTYLKAVNDMGGDISILNTGALITDATTAISNSVGKISLTAQSPLTVGAAGITAGSDVTLTAGGPSWVTGETGDNLTINGPVTSSSGNILLVAGNSISGAGVLTAASGTITKTASLNPPAAPTTPTIDQCVVNPTLSGCTSVLPSIATCTANPAAPGCSAVLPSIATCTTTPTAAGCSAVLPSISTCTTTPTAPGCSAVLPSLDLCTATPSAPGCSAVLPSIATCTTNPAAPGCSAVLPSIATCTTTPTAAGCTAVLPNISTCTTTPTAPGCSAVLPSLDLCTATPSAPGCSAVLPSIATCTTNPVAPGCSAVLPSIATCTTTPTAAGCTAVLPSISTCTTTPTAPGCSAVLPSLDLCTTNPAAPGCSAVLPSIATCTTTPTAAGCTAVLPNISTCTTTPTAPGCSAVLPSLDLCTATPSAPGCSAVLPSIATCTTNPAAPGCTAVLPTLATCSTTPSAPGCSAVLPTIDTCTTNPSAPGCTAVLPKVADCSSNPSLPGCATVLPVQEQKPVTQAVNQIVKDIEQTQTTPVAPAGLQLVSLAPKQDDAPTSTSSTTTSDTQSKSGGSDGGAGGGTTESKKDAEEKEKDKDKQRDAQEQKPAGGDKKDEKAKKNYCN